MPSSEWVCYITSSSSGPIHYQLPETLYNEDSYVKRKLDLTKPIHYQLPGTLYNEASYVKRKLDLTKPIQVKILSGFYTARPLHTDGPKPYNILFRVDMKGLGRHDIWVDEYGTIEPTTLTKLREYVQGAGPACA